MQDDRKTRLHAQLPLLMYFLLIAFLLSFMLVLYSHIDTFPSILNIRARLLGLDVCIDTVCGNDLLKGISGGQKKRVTTGEMMVGRMPCLFMDEISTGLDSASTFLISKALRNSCHYMNVRRAPHMN